MAGDRVAGQNFEEPMICLRRNPEPGSATGAKSPATPRYDIYVYIYIYGDFPKLRVLFRGPHYRDYSIFGSKLGSPYFETTIHIYIHIYTLYIEGVYGN